MNVRLHYLPYLTTTEVEAMPKDPGLVLLPVGSVEQHGPHLPLLTDCLIVEDIVARALAALPDDFPVWTLPTLAYGKSNEHNAFPGSMTLDSDTLLHQVKEIGAGVARGKFLRFATLSGHGGNNALLEVASRDIRVETGLITFALRTRFRSKEALAALTDDERRYGMHGGDMETSMMLRIRPDLVRMDKATKSIPDRMRRMKYPAYGGDLHFAWLATDVTDEGFLGDAAAATPEKGEAFLADRAAQLVELLQDAVDFNFGR